MAHRDHIAMAPTSLDVDMHDIICKEKEKYCNSRLDGNYPNHESALVLRDHLCKEPSSIDSK